VTRDGDSKTRDVSIGLSMKLSEERMDMQLLTEKVAEEPWY
jgi:hypothetical protein